MRTEGTDNSDVMWMRGQIEVMSHGHRVTQERHTGAIVTSHGGTRMEGTHPCNVTWTHGDTRTEGTDNSDVTWTRCDTRMEGTRSDVTWAQHDMRTCHMVAHGWRGHVVMSHGLMVLQGRVTL